MLAIQTRVNSAALAAWVKWSAIKQTGLKAGRKLFTRSLDGTSRRGVSSEAVWTILLLGAVGALAVAFLFPVFGQVSAMGSKARDNLQTAPW